MSHAQLYARKCTERSFVAQIDKKRFLIYGGLNGRTRYTDLWIFDIQTKTWEQPKARCVLSRLA